MKYRYKKVKLFHVGMLQFELVYYYYAYVTLIAFFARLLA